MAPRSQILDPATGMPMNVAGRYDSPYAEQYGKSFQQALGMLQRPELGAQGRSMQGAEGQMWQGIEQQQQLAQAQASRRGFDPGAARAAGQAGGELVSRGYGMAEQIRAQEEAARRAAMLGIYQQRGKFDVEQAGMATAQMQEQLNQRAIDAAIQAQIDERKRQEEQAIIGGILGAAGSAASVLSDERMKRGIKPGGRDIDAMMGMLGDGYGKR